MIEADITKLLPETYLNFIKKFDKPPKFNDEENHLEWTLATLSDLKDFSSNQPFCFIVQRLAAEFNYSCTNNETGEIIGQSFFENLITIGKTNSYFLCINQKGEVWSWCDDPRSMTLLAPSFDQWDGELIDLRFENNYPEIFKSIVGEWETVSCSEDGNIECMGTYIFNDDKTCLNKTSDCEINYIWGIHAGNDLNKIYLIDTEDEDEMFYEILSLSAEQLIIDVYDDQYTLQRIK